MYFFVVIAIIMMLILIVIGFRFIKRSKLKTKQMLAVLAFQEENKLSSRDLKVFKEVMSEAKKQILLAEQSSEWIEDSHNDIFSALNASKEIFKYLMDEPKDIVLYGDFLYRSLPAYSSALERREKMEMVKVEGGEVIQTKNELDHVLAELSVTILDTYDEYMNNELEDAQIENMVARRKEKGASNG